MNRILEGRAPVSVVIPALNEERYLPVLLHSLLQCATRETEVIVVDGQSEDDTRSVAEAWGRMAPPHVTVRVLTSSVRNVSAQRNQGAAEARHDLLVFLDADTVVPSAGRFESLIGGFERGRLGAASCRFTPIERDPRAILYFGLLYGFHKLVERWNPYALGACIVTTRHVFRRVGGFDATIRVNEDAAFCRAATRYAAFRILPVAIGTSARRFAKHGYLRMGLQYLQLFIDRTVHGETRNERVTYEFGQYH